MFSLSRKNNTFIQFIQYVLIYDLQILLLVSIIQNICLYCITNNRQCLFASFTMRGNMQFAGLTD